MKLLTTFTLLALTSISLSAQPRSEAQMQQAACHVLNTAGITRQNSPSIIKQCETFTIYGYREGGYAIISASENMPEVLAYSLKPFNKQGNNPGFQWWMQAMERATKYYEQHNIVRSHTTPDPELYPDHVDKLVKSTWGQGAPYYYMCPMGDHSDTDTPGAYQPKEGHCYVGCVATATSQIMNYYKYPAHATGGRAGITVADDPTETLYEVNFDEASYDWDNILDDYSGDYNEEQAKAIATLSYHVGVASGMQYGMDGSGSYNQVAMFALGKYFKYDTSTMEQKMRSEFEEAEWMDMIYKELSESRPILYQAIDVNLELGILGGHSFLFDGYDEEGRVHVNWGWYGEDDGYFFVDALNPRVYTFNEYQDMVIGIRPEEGATAIHSVNKQPADNSIYTLDGRKLSSTSSLSKGIYISQGRKYVVR